MFLRIQNLIHRFANNDLAFRWARGIAAVLAAAVIVLMADPIPASGIRQELFSFRDSIPILVIAIFSLVSILISLWKKSPFESIGCVVLIAVVLSVRFFPTIFLR